MKKRKIIKALLLGLPILIILAAIFIIGSSYLQHQNLVAEEKEKYPAPGVLVAVNDNDEKLHVYTEGEGDETLVLMSGYGISSPYYDFQPLYRELVNDFKVIVVERGGYGWSDITDSARDIDTVLGETRTALKKAGANPPYILLPHSLAGIEAIYWAQQYPEEVKMIIGLDPLVPEYYIATEDEPEFPNLIAFLAQTGLMRSQPEVCQNNFPAIQKGHLSATDIEVACTIFYRRTFTKNMRAEAKAIGVNAEIVLQQAKLTVPFHCFIGKESDQKWQTTISSFAQANNGEVYLLEAGHHLHLEQPQLIAEKSRALIVKR